MVDKLLEYGVGFAYALVISVVMAISAIALLTVVLFASWWDKVR